MVTLEKEVALKTLILLNEISAELITKSGDEDSVAEIGSSQKEIESFPVARFSSRIKFRVH